jgi:hypothetical protein
MYQNQSHGGTVPEPEPNSFTVPAPAPPYKTTSFDSSMGSGSGSLGFLAVLLTNMVKYEAVICFLCWG